MKIRFAVAPQATTPATELIAFGDAAERAGFDGVWLSDLPLSSAVDPLLGLALLAGSSERMHLGANVVPLGHNPYLLAKSLAQLDVMSGGRLLLSFVTGVHRAGERDALGIGGRSRGELLEESLSLIRAWWAGETVRGRSGDWRFEQVPSPGRPAQDPLEVWLGGRGRQALDRAGRCADGWLGAAVTPTESGDARARIRTAAAAAERELDPEHFGMSIPYARDEPLLEALATMARRRTDVDPREYIGAGRDGLRWLIDGYLQAGLSKFVVRPVGAVASWDEELGWLAEAILDLQT